MSSAPIKVFVFWLKEKGQNWFRGPGRERARIENNGRDDMTLLQPLSGGGRGVTGIIGISCLLVFQ